MSDEPAKIILGDTAISAFERTGGKRRSGRGEDSAPPLTHCENCGADLKGHWCAKCGQPAIEYRRSFRYVVSDLLNEFLNWDSKFFTTIALLIVKPWRLTNEFLAGKRVRYVNPLRLYLLASILFFFAVNYGAKGIRIDPTKFPEEKRAEVAAAIADKRDEIEAELKKENLTPEQRRKAQKALEYLTKPTSSATTTPTPEETPSPSAAPGGSPTAESGGQQKYGPVGDRPFVVFDDAKSTTPFERWIEGRAKEKMGEQGTKMGLFISTLLSNLPYMMLCCIPLFALVLKLLYIRRRRFYIDHLIYALHIHSFFYAAVMLIVLLTIGLTRFTPGAIAGWLIALLWIAFVTQIFLSIRYVYRQGWFFSILKFLFGGFMYLVVLVLALAATFFATLLLPWE
jgi:ribosomal protein L32